MARRKSVDQGDSSTRERMLDAGLEMFARKGFIGATTKEISARAGVNEVTLFRHFGSKKDLYAAVISERSPIADVREEMSFDMGTPVDVLLRNNAASVLSALRANRQILMMLMGDAWRVSKARSIASQFGVGEEIAVAEELMKALIDAGMIRRMDPKVAARALVGMVQSYFLTADLLAGRKLDPEEDERMLNGFVDIFLDGVRVGGDG